MLTFQINDVKDESIIKTVADQLSVTIQLTK